MTWDDLLLLLTNMKKEKHSIFDPNNPVRVTAVFEDVEYYMDMSESLTAGKAFLMIDCLTDGTEVETGDK